MNAKHRGSRFRVPRKSRLAESALYAGRPLTAKQRARLARMLVMRPLGWRGVRKVATHVAMGSTSALRARARRSA